MTSRILAGQVVKVADFGVARVQAQSGVMTAETGTYRWMAPEVGWFCQNCFDDCNFQHKWDVRSSFPFSLKF